MVNPSLGDGVLLPAWKEAMVQPLDLLFDHTLDNYSYVNIAENAVDLQIHSTGIKLNLIYCRIKM